MTDQNPSEPRLTKAEVLDHMNRAYTRLEETLRPLSEAQLSRPGPEGWAVKDHLTHLAAWEAGIVALLQHADRFAAMGLTREAIKGKSEDEINDLIYHQNTHLSAAEALDKFHHAHAQMVEMITNLDEAELYRPYVEFLPPGVNASQNPIMGWIRGNTYEHVTEHLDWINTVINSLS